MRARFALNILAILALTLAVSAMFAPLAIRSFASHYIFESLADVPKTDVAIVLGASVVAGKPSPILEERAHAAVELFQAGKVGKILVTGDSVSLSHDEVTPVRTYLIDAGIPADDIVLDRAGLDTYSSMYRARETFGIRALTVVTQDFHLPRAVFIARMLGLDAYGYHAAGGGTGSDYLREIPASIKALSDLVSHRSLESTE